MAAAALAVAAFCALEALPAVPGHQQASLLGDLVASDAGAVMADAVPFLRDHPSGPCSRLEAEFEVGNHLLQNAHVGWYATIWESYQALKALYVASLTPDGPGCTGNFLSNLNAIDARYWDTSLGRGPAAFDQGPHGLHIPSDLPRVDDNLWMGLAAIRGYLISRSPVLLRRAEAVFHLAVANWDPVKGGIYWEYHTAGTTNYEKAVVSNAEAIVMGASLYSETADRSYLTWSDRILRWLRDNLVDPRTGLYDDDLDDHGRRTTVVTAKFTYNQGIMVGAMTALSQVDPERYPLRDAVDLASRAMAYFRSHHTYGQPPFDAIWADNLLGAAGLYRDPGFIREARSSVSLAISAEPPDPGGLLDYGGEAALHELARLPPSRYAALSYVIRPR